MTAHPAMTAIRGVDPDLWHQVRVEALMRKLTAGDMLNEILREWTARLGRSGVMYRSR